MHRTIRNDIIKVLQSNTSLSFDDLLQMTDDELLVEMERYNEKMMNNHAVELA